MFNKRKTIKEEPDIFEQAEKAIVSMLKEPGGKRELATHLHLNKLFFQEKCT